jgi:tetratricopeptide (TPR) repeat protein
VLKNWLEGRKVKKIAQTAQTQQQTMAAHWQAELAKKQQTLLPLLQVLIRAQMSGLVDEDYNVRSYAVYAAMTGDSREQMAESGVLPDEADWAFQIGDRILSLQDELCELALSVAHLSALALLSNGIDVATLVPNDKLLEFAQRYIDHAIKWATSPASLSTYLSTAAQINMTWGRFPAALEAADRATEADPGNVESIRMLGMANYANGDLDEAAELLKMAQLMSPSLQGVTEALKMIESESGVLTR